MCDDKIIAKVSGHLAAVPGPGNFCVQLRVLLDFLDKGTSRKGLRDRDLMSAIFSQVLRMLFSIVDHMRDSSPFRMAFPGPFAWLPYCIGDLQAYQ
jgi:hypothetical protein